MFNKLKALLMGIIFALAAMPLQASTSNIDRLLELSGFTGTIDALPQSIDSAMDLDTLTTQVGDRRIATLIINVTKQSFTKSLFEEEARSSLSSRLTESEISGILAWYDTDAGQRIGAAHQADQLAIQQRVKAGERPQLTEKRNAQLKLLDQLSMGTDNARRLALDSSTNIAHAMMSGLGMPVSKPQVRDMSAAEIDAQMPQIISEYYASLGFIYESVSDADMDALLSRLIEPDATIFYDAMWNGMSAAFNSAGISMGATLAGEIRGAM